jgi:hypothetical protein
MRSSEKMALRHPVMPGSDGFRSSSLFEPTNNAGTDPSLGPCRLFSSHRQRTPAASIFKARRELRALLSELEGKRQGRHSVDECLATQGQSEADGQW